MLNMKSIVLAIAFAAIPCAGYSASKSAPLDFNYRVSGATEVRPSLVFNDGNDTYIQPSGKTRIVWVKGGGASVERSGAYFVVSGTPQKIELVDENNDTATVSYQGSGGGFGARSIVDLGGGYSPKGALPTLGWSGLQPALPKSCGGVQKEESILAVNFEGNALKLTGERESVVATAAKNHGTTQVLITAPNGDDLEIVRKRNDYLTKVITSVGVHQNNFQYARGATIDGATEITLVRTETIECEPGKPIVTKDGNLLTILAKNTDASILLNEIAHSMGLRFSVEGPVRLTPIDFEVYQSAQGVALHKLGAAVAAWATVVLRDDELVLRFK
jgi:hypothetical protein